MSGIDMQDAFFFSLWGFVSVGDSLSSFSSLLAITVQVRLFSKYEYVRLVG
jgi:hypothetical protein